MPCMLPTLEIRDERIALIFILRRLSVPMNHARGASRPVGRVGLMAKPTHHSEPR